MACAASGANPRNANDAKVVRKTTYSMRSDIERYHTAISSYENSTFIRVPPLAEHQSNRKAENKQFVSGSPAFVLLHTTR